MEYRKPFFNPLFEIIAPRLRSGTVLEVVMCEFFAKKILLKLKLNFLRKKFTHILPKTHGP